MRGISWNTFHRGLIFGACTRLSLLSFVSIDPGDRCIPFCLEAAVPPVPRQGPGWSWAWSAGECTLRRGVGERFDCNTTCSGVLLQGAVQPPILLVVQHVRRELQDQPLGVLLPDFVQSLNRVRDQPWFIVPQRNPASDQHGFVLFKYGPQSYNRIWCLRSWKKAVYLVD